MPKMNSNLRQLNRKLTYIEMLSYALNLAPIIHKFGVICVP